MSSYMTDIVERPKMDRRLSLLTPFCIGVSIFIIVFAVIGFPAIVSTANATTAINRTQEINACKGALFGDVVQKLAVWDAAVGDAVAVGPGADKTAITRATQDLKDAANLYKLKANQAKDNPDNFLAQCQ